MINTNSFKALVLCFFLTILSNVSAQPSIERIISNDSLKTGDLVFLSRVPNPNSDVFNCIKSIVTEKREFLNAQYQFIETSEKQWYCNNVFFKLFLKDKNAKSWDLFDTRNNMFLTTWTSNKLFELHPKRLTDPFDFFFKTFPQGTTLCRATTASTYMYAWKGWKDDKKDSYVYYLDLNAKNQADKFCTDGVPDESHYIYAYVLPETDYINEGTPFHYIITKYPTYHLIQRNYKLGGTYNTLVLPVDMVLKDFNHQYNEGHNKMQLYRLESVDNNAMHFVSDNSGVIEARRPYILKSEANDNTTATQFIQECYVSSEKQMVPRESLKDLLLMDGGNIKVFMSDFENITEFNSKDAGTYIMHNNKLINCKNAKQGVAVNRFRWYVKRSGKDSAPISLYFDGVSNISDINLNTGSNNAIYDMYGRKYDSKNDLRKGLYIEEGKIKIKGE